MDIRFVGLTSLLLRTSKATVIIDPLAFGTGARGQVNEADIVILSRPGSPYYSTEKVKASYTISNPGEYEVKGVMVFGYPVEEEGKLTIMYEIIADGVSLLHLGALTKKPKNGLFEELGTIDILAAPVGGMFSIDAKQAKEFTQELEPQIVIPINYQVEGLSTELKAGLAPLREFLTEMDAKAITPEPKLKIDKTQIHRGDERKTEIVVLSPTSFK